jgi:hypothetical protein
MGKRVVPVIIVAIALAAFAFVSLVGGAGAVTNHSFTTTERAAIVSSTERYPGTPGSKAVLAGRQVNHVDGQLARGADIRRVEIISISGTKVTFKGTGIAYYPEGSLKTEFRGVATPYANGTSTHKATGRITGGTGIYQGATGQLTATGSMQKSGISIDHIKGTVSY